MSDISTLWNTTRGDWVLDGGDLARGSDIVTSVLISIFSDRVATNDDVVPDATRRLRDPRGWWADQSIGSRLWLLDRAKRTQETLQRAQSYIAEALQWMIDDGVASRIDVSAEWTRQSTLGAQVIVYSPRTGRPLVKVGTQNIFRLPDAQAWGWNAEHGVGQWVELQATHPAPPPDPNVDPYWNQVLLHLNGDDLADFKRDWSPLQFATGANGTPALNTTHAKYGAGCIDLRFGEITVAPDHVYSDALGAGEFTLRWWTFVFGYPINGNDRIAFFGPFDLGIDAGGGGSLMSTEINDLAGGGRTAYVPTAAPGSYPTGQWVHSALTRTNDGLFAHIDLFVDGQKQTPSSTFSADSPASTTGFAWVGGGGGTNCLADDFQLTAVNRYRDLDSFVPPARLPTHG